MSDRDTTSNDEHEHLGNALADLADTMPENPYRVEGIHARARRLRTRRRVSRATAGVVVGAATIAALVAVRPGASNVSTIPASGTTSPLPACSAALAAAPTQAVRPTVDASVAAAEAAKQAAADAANAANAANQAATRLQGVKGIGVIVSATDETVTITLEEPMADDPSEITATVSPTAKFADGEDKVNVRPTVNAGDRVAFGATLADDGSYELIFLAVHLPEQPVPTTETVDPARKAAGAAADDRYLKAMAEVTAAQPDSLTLKITDGDLRDQIITTQTGPDVLYIAGDQKCVDPQLSPGQEVGVVLLHADNGDYTVQELMLQPPAIPKGP